ncbi:MAG: acetoin utilization protein AcuC [Promethearchaeota archaeon]
MAKKVGLIFSEDFYKYNFGQEHPLRPERLELTYKLMELKGLLDHPNLKIIKPPMALKEEILLVHDMEYVNCVEKYSNLPPQQFYIDNPRGMFGLGTMDDPVFPGMYESSAMVVGASIKATDLVINNDEFDIAFNFAGGLHHAGKKKAHGFCIFNDIAVAIQKARLKHPDLKVFYLDVDAHHGDGVQDIFYEDPNVFTVSFHQDGNTLFPGTGFLDEIGKNEGKYRSVNFPLYPGTYDEAFLEIFEEFVPQLMDKFKPDVLFTQLGVDTHFLDPLTMLGLSTSGHEKIYKLMKKYSKEYANGKWIAVGGGGYLMTVVPRSWTMALGVMLDVPVSNDIPQEWIELCEKKNIDEDIPLEMRDKNLRAEENLIKNPMFAARIDDRMRKIADYISKNILPNL